MNFYIFVLFFYSNLVNINSELPEDNFIFNQTLQLTQSQPSYGEQMSDSVGVQLSYDETYLYVVLDVYQDTAILISKNSIRDNGFDQDYCGFIIDPLGTSQEGYAFLFGLGGNFMDARILKSTGGTEEYSWDSDVIFTTERTNYGYRIESSVPFSNFRRSRGNEQKWIINIIRNKCSTNEKGLYRLPEKWCANYLFQDGIEILLTDIGTNEPVFVKPYGIWGGEIDNGIEVEKGDAGFDIRAPFGSSSVTNFAFNPDFSQLEGDPLQFDFNTRYALYYSEYRPFFLEERGIFQTHREIFYTRSIYNPFLAGRYSFKTSANQFGAIVSYDETDTAIGNPDAYLGAIRYKRTLGENYLGIMLLGSQNKETEDINYIIMTDADLSLCNDVFRGDYAFAVSQNYKKNESNNIAGYFYETEFGYHQGNFGVGIYNTGLSHYYENKIGFISKNDFQSIDMFFDYTVNFNKPVLKSISIGIYPGASGTWKDFYRDLKNNFDTLEYFYAVSISIDAFSSLESYLWFSSEKTIYDNKFFYQKGLEFNLSSKLISTLDYWVGGYSGYDIDYNYSRLGEKIIIWGGLSGSIYEKLSFNIKINIQNFYADTSGFALKASEIKTTDWQWTSYKPIVNLVLSPNNNYSVTLSYQKLWADFASYYWKPDNYDLDENNFFALFTYKPTTGDYIYFGIRFPEKLLFFKFTHRFEF